MRSRLALAGLAGAAAFAAPVAPASAYCQQPVIAIGPGGGGCTNGCYETGEAYEKVRLTLAEKVAAAEAIPGYGDLFTCLA